MEGQWKVMEGSGHLVVPVRVLVPEEGIDGLAGGAEVVRLELVGHLAHERMAARDDPALRQRQRLHLGGAHGLGHRERLALCLAQLAEAHHDEARRVPQLVGKVAVGRHLLHCERHVLAGGAAGDEREAEGVGAVLLDRVDGVDDVALSLRHLLAVAVAHEAVHVDRVEG